MKTRISKCKLLLMLAVAILIVGIAMILVWKFALKKDNISRGAVVTNGHGCSDIGKSILEKGGSIADAAIATLFCEGVSMPQSMGLGGGFLLTIYLKDQGIVETLDARESAPDAATVDMFHGNADSSSKGGLAPAVPGELKGYWSLHQKYGVLAWKDLVQPTIDLCINGIYVTEFLARTFLGKVDLLLADPVLRESFIDPATNSTYKEGQYVKRLRLARSLEIISQEGADALYSKNGSLIEGFVQDIKQQGGIISVEDMVNYNPVWTTPINTTLLNDYTMYTMPLPGSGPVLTFILNILDKFVDLSELYTSQTFQKIVESFKFAYGHRTQLGDSFNNNYTDVLSVSDLISSKSYAEQIKEVISLNTTSQNASVYGADTVGVEDHGTAHVSILAPNGDAVSVTSTINQVFGAGFASNSTGIILNDEMDDFSAPNITNAFGLPPSPSNFIAPGKRPLSSMVPTIILKNKDVVFVTGAAGGSKITTVVASVILKHLYYNVDLAEAISEKRVHHQLFPMKIEYEEGFDDDYPDIVKNLTDIGHLSEYIPTADGFSAITSITALKDLQGCWDPRRGGYVSYINT